MHFEIRKCTIILTQGDAALDPSPLSRALPLDPTRGPIGAGRTWTPPVDSCASRSMFLLSLQAIPKSWKPW